MRPALLPLVLCLILASAAPLRAEGVVPAHVQVEGPESVLVGAETTPLAVSTLCSTDPARERKWLLRNLTPQAVTVTWQIVEDPGQGATVTLPPGGSANVTAKAQAGVTTLRWLVGGEVKGTLPNWGARCGGQQRTGPLTWQQKGGGRAPTRPAKPAPGRNLTWRQGAPQQAPTRPAKPAPGRSLTWRQGAPQTPKPQVQVTPLCARQPEERRWKVRNIGPAPLTLTFDLEGTQRGNLVLDPGAETVLTLPAGPPPNRLRLYAGGALLAEVPAPYLPCDNR